MKILVVGSGGREHTLVWKLSQSPEVEDLYCAPGNGGISQIADCVDIDDTDIVDLADFAQDLNIDLTVVGPEAPLAMGIVDKFIERGLRIFGPRKDAAQIEASKVFAKELMKKYDIPTGDFTVFNSPQKAKEHIKSLNEYPAVVKADGLAAGKGVLISETQREALEAVDTIMIDKKFGNAGDRVVIEDFLEGEETSFIVFTDGTRAVPMVASQDHKAAYDGDEGPNTGGMGAFSPSAALNSEHYKSIMKEIIYPTIKALKKEGRQYQGVLYAGLMITNDGPKVLEFNCRFGDPEAQVILPRMETDLVPVMQSVIDRDLENLDTEWKKNAAATVVLASGGYPVSYEKGFEIKGLEEAQNPENVTVFHAGTRRDGNSFYTNGGRVLGVTSTGSNLSSSIKNAYRAVDKIKFDNMHYRTDIGKNALEEEQNE